MAFIFSSTEFVKSNFLLMGLLKKILTLGNCPTFSFLFDLNLSKKICLLEILTNWEIQWFVGAVLCT